MCNALAEVLPALVQLSNGPLHSDSKFGHKVVEASMTASKKTPLDWGPDVPMGLIEAVAVQVILDTTGRKNVRTAGHHLLEVGLLQNLLVI